MRRHNRFFNPNVESSVDGVIGAHCSVKVISGQFLSDRRIGTYVEVDMFGLPSDTIRKEFKTRIVPGNGLNPVYNEDPFVFRKIVLPDLAVLRIGVYEETGKLIGQRIIPFDVLQAGYRHISLRTEGNYPLALSTIFCHIVLKTYVPDGLGDFVNALNNPCRNLITDDLLSPEYDKKNKWKERLLKPARDNFLEIKDQLRNDLKMDALKRSKRFQKLIAKQDKDTENMKKKHRKDQALMQHQHVVAIEKLLLTFVKDNTQINATMNSSKKRNKVLEIIKEQEKEWTDLIQQQQKEFIDLKMLNVQQQMDTLRLSVVDVQFHQIQVIEKRQERETKDLKSSQVKQSIEETKNILSDRSIRNKAERERRIKELNSNNTKRFIEERKRLKMKHDREMDSLRKIHQEEELNLLHETKKVLQISEKSSREFLQSQEPSCCV